MKKKRVTITSLAKELDLTPATVSRALNNKSDISEQTKLKVSETAQKLGYINNFSAASLRKGNSMLIAIVCDNIINPYYSIMTTFVTDQLDKYNYLPITFTSPKGILDIEIFSAILSRNVDGVISYLELTEEVALLAKKNNVPIVLLGRKSLYPNISCVEIDDYEGGVIAANHLIERGGKDILFISERIDISCVKERFLGFKNTLIKKKLFNENLTIFYDGTETIIEKLKKLYFSGIKFDSIFCFNDILAFEIIDFLYSQNFYAFKIVGFDYIQEKLRIPNQLTTIGFNKSSMAKAVVEIILTQINKKSKVLKIDKIPVFLIEGNTT